MSALQVHSFIPSAGPPGAVVSADVQYSTSSLHDKKIRLRFGAVHVVTSVHAVQGRWLVMGTVPDVGLSSVEMYVEVVQDSLVDAEQKVLESVQFGQWTYDALPPPPAVVHSAVLHTEDFSIMPQQPRLVRTTQSTEDMPQWDDQQVTLNIQGPLDDMAVGWTVDEWQSKRRLVQFWRRQEKSTIHATFKNILPAEYVLNSIVVSCIYRPGIGPKLDKCYITSVDCIFLLEALVGVRFPIEEKNRIRRNLAEFKPDTISRNKPDCADFFRQIMDFPPPRPRIIEKDVKVFEWSLLVKMLSKILNKYSAIRLPQSDGLATSYGIPPPVPGMSGMSGITGEEDESISYPA